MNDEVLDRINKEFEISQLPKRVEMLEKIFGKIMQLDMRIDTLEFNCNLPVKPAISEKLLDMELRLQKLESLLIKDAPNDRSNE